MNRHWPPTADNLFATGTHLGIIPMETDKNSTASDTRGGIRPRHNQGVDNNGPCNDRAFTDESTNVLPQRVKCSENAQSGVPGTQIDKEGKVVDGRNCNGGSRSPVGSDKCDTNAAEEDSLASVHKDSRYTRKEMAKEEFDDKFVKREPTGAGDELNRASPSRDHTADLIKQEEESKERKILDENGDAELSDGGEKPDPDRKGKSVDESPEDAVAPDDVQLHPHCGEDDVKQSTERILDGLSKVEEGAGLVSSDGNLPIDMTMASGERKPTASGNQKPAKSEGKLKSDGLRPVGRMLHDLGLDLVRQQVYKDLIGIQVAKDSKNMLEEKEKEQLKRLTDAHAKLIVKNAMFQLPFATCRCGYSSSSSNVLALHQEFGSTYEAPFHACCMCEELKTRWPSQFLSHVESAHDRKGRVQAKMAPNVCKYCPYEHKNLMRMEVHVTKCFKKFNLNTNLQPLPADCDVPLLGKSAQPGNPHQARPGLPAAYPSPAHQVAKQMIASAAASVQPSVMEIGGQLYSLVHHNGKALFTSLRSQMGNSPGSGSNSGAPAAGTPPAGFSRFVQPQGRPVSKGASPAKPLPNQRREKCEMCDAVVTDREALWIHFRMMHKVELSKVSMIEKEPWMMCDVCTAKFWTYQGLARHSMQLHKRELAPPSTPTKSFKCFLCLQVQTNPLNHLSTYHNITLLDMYHSRRCCMCNRRFRAAPAFEEHMVLQHHDIFANKDVLCTVLQALSTALSLKRQETVQPRGASVASPRGGQRGGHSVAGQVRSVPELASSPGQRRTPETPSSSGRGHPDMRKRGHRRKSGEDRAKEAAAAGKTTPKKTTEEDTKELNKLYKDYADIGRPILRSMRHRLSQGGTEKAENATDKAENATEKAGNATEKAGNASPTGSKSKEPGDVVGDQTVSENEHAQAERDLANRSESDEPCAKKLCLDSLRNDVETNDSESTDHHRQLQEINNVEMASLAEGQKAS